MKTKINTAVWSISKLKVNPKSSCDKKKKTFFSSFVVCLYEMMNVNQTFCDDHFTIYLSQIIVLYTLNLHSVVCQLYLNKLREN